MCVMNKCSKFFLSFLISLLSVCAYSDSYRVTAKTLNVREKASSKSAIVDKLKQGDMVEGQLDGKWVEITSSGQRGFVSAKYLEKVENKPVNNVIHKDNFHLSLFSMLKWIVGLLVVFFIVKFVLKNFSWKQILFLVIMAIVVPPVGRFVLGMIGLPTAGYIIGWAFVLLVISAAFSSVNDDKSKTGSDDWNNNPDIDYEDRKLMTEQRQLHEDFDDFDDDDFENNNDDFDERQRQHDREEELEKERERMRAREENEEHAADWRRKYEDYSEKAKDAKERARFYREEAQRYYGKEQDTGDENYLARAREYDQDADTEQQNYEEYKRLANEAERNMDYYNSKKWDY